MKMEGRINRILVILALGFFSWFSAAHAQISLPGSVSLNKDIHDFGDILEGNPRVADFVIFNNGKEDLFLLRAEVPENVVYRYAAKKVLPGESGTIRLKYNPTQKGSFHENILIYYSAAGKPFKLTLTGNVKFVDRSDDLACPDFNDPVENKQVTQDFTVQVIDKATMQPISNARVSFEPNPNLIPVHLTNTDGICKNTMPVDLYDIDVYAKGYEPSSQTIYIGKNITSTVFLLEKLPHPIDSTIFAQRDNPKPEDTPVIEQKPEPKPEIEQKPEPKPKDTTTHKPGVPIQDQIINKIDLVFKPTPKKPKPEPEPKNDSLIVFKEKPGELPAVKYGPNNIVFLIDVSSSMATRERLPLVKIAMKNLLKTLRSIDRVSIVTYASGTKLVLESTSADQKELIEDKIDKLVARGTTEGGKGIREAYKIATQNFIKNGNNQIFIATDGDFNLEKSEEGLYRFIKHKAEGGITMSVVGVGNIPRALKQMQVIAEKGSGSFIHITSAEQAAGVLIDEIMLRSVRK